MELADKHGEQAKELVEETYRDVVKVLEEKGKKAKDLGEKVASDAKKDRNNFTDIAYQFKSLKQCSSAFNFNNLTT